MGFSLKILTILIAGLTLIALPVQADFGLHAGSHFGFGELEGESSLKTAIGYAPKRSASTFDIQAMPEYNFTIVRAGLMMEYRWVNEFERNYSGSNKLSGNTVNLGLAADFVPGPWKFLVGYDFKSTHTLTSANISYYGSGFRILMGYEFLPAIRFDFQYTKTNFNEMKDETGKTDISDNKLSQWNLGFGLSYTY